MLEEALRAKVLSSTDVTDDIGQRLYMLKMPQSPTYPAVTYFKVSRPRHHDIDVAYPRYQFDTWAENYLTARRVADNIRRALQREKGTWGNVKVIQGVYLDESDDYEPDTKLYHIATDYKIIYRSE